MNFNLCKFLAFAGATLAAVASGARGDIVNVDVRGEVEWNMITTAPLNGAVVGQNATLSFSVDSNNFVNNPSYPTRGYPIDLNSFKLKFPTFEIGLQNPYPVGQTPYFVLRNNDPGVDGFMVSSGTGFPDGVPLNQAGGSGNFGNNFYATYGGSLLSSLDVLGAIGHYDFTGLTVFNWTLEDGPFDAMGIVFEDMTISAVPEPGSTALLLLLPSAMLSLRRRK